MDKKIYLISPPAGEKRKSYPYSLMYLHSHLLKNGFGSEVLDCDVVGWKPKDLVSYLEKNKAAIVGITAYTYNRFCAYRTIKEIKSKLPECYIIVGGRHFSALATEALERLKEIDFVVRGEGEITLKELCEAVYDNKPVDGILGVTFRKNGKIVSNPDRPVAPDLDAINYNLDDFFSLKGKYDFVSTMRRFPTSKGFTVIAGRGCPGSCVFCTLSAQRIRLRRVGSVLDEIERLIKITGVRNVSFGDPTLTASKKYITELCEGILRRNLNIKWHCYSRVDTPFEVFDLMRKAGCVSVDIALESASPRILQAIKKNIKPEEVLKCAQKLHDLGIKTFVFAMISLPDERQEDAEETVAFLKKISGIIDGASLALTQVFPDAALYKMAKERNLLPPGFNWFDDYHCDDYYDRNSAKSTAPFYIEHLSMDFIKKMKGRFEKVYMKRFYDKHRFKTEFSKAIRPFIFDWKNQTVHTKIRKIRKGISRLPYLLKDGTKSGV